MPFMSHFIQSTTPPGVQVLIIAALVVFFLLIVLVESVILQLLRWGDAKSSWWAALWMNLASALIVFVCISLTPRLGLMSLLISWVFSVFVERLVLMRLKHDQARYTWLVAIIANLASFMVLLLPTYFFSR